MNEIPITREKLLEQKRDYSPFLVHLTRSTPRENAKEVLCHILDDRVLQPVHAWCVWYKDIESSDDANFREKFKVVCFTETPLDLIEILLKPVQKRLTYHQPYGLVFKKEYIREKGGNPVFYVTKKIVKPLNKIYEIQKSSIDVNMCRLLALTTICDDWNDWHWEREWRIIGELRFEYENIYCALCPEDNIPFFENRYSCVTFIDPYWRMNRILDELVKKAREAQVTTDANDIPF